MSKPSNARGFRRLLASLTAFLETLFARVKTALFFWQRRDNLTPYLDHFRADGVGKVPESERSLIPSFQKCQVCSQCTFSCQAILEGRAPSSFEPKYLLLGLGRSPHESEIFLEEWLPCAECQQCTVQCPNDVPIHAMVGQILERRARVAFRGDPLAQPKEL